MSARLPYAIREAVVAVCGKCFWYRDPFRDFMLSCGVPPEIYDRFADETGKFKLARHVLAELDKMGEEGFLIQRRLVTELARLRKPPDEKVPNREAALDALRALKEAAIEHGMLVSEEKAKSQTRAQEAKRRQDAHDARAKKMEQLRSAFASMAASTEDPQERGYGLEDLLADLFGVHELTYRPPYKTGAEQIDGHFGFKSFDYLVEARWRATQPGLGDLNVLKGKVDKKITSTRGLFVSVPGFRTEVVAEFTRGVSSNVVLMDGSDLMMILEGRVSLTDALEFKIQKAAQEGIVFCPLSERF